MKINFEQFFSMSIEFNPHKGLHQSVAAYIGQQAELLRDESHWCGVDWRDRETYDLACETNTLIEVRVYPNTSVGFNTYYGVNLEDVLSDAQRDMECGPMWEHGNDD